MSEFVTLNNYSWLTMGVFGQAVNACLDSREVDDQGQPVWTDVFKDSPALISIYNSTKYVEGCEKSREQVTMVIYGIDGNLLFMGRIANLNRQQIIQIAYDIILSVGMYLVKSDGRRCCK